MDGDIVKVAGIVIAVAGLFTEGLGAAALASYRVRRRLPSPFTLSSLGGIAFFAGIIIAGIGCALGSPAP